ncbi:MAG: hypothetical protein AAFV72_00305 [Cyanobacteria bacterium J06635_1]
MPNFQVGSDFFFSTAANTDAEPGASAETVATAVTTLQTRLDSPLPLPTGAATQSTLAAIQTALATLQAAVDSLATQAETQPVSIASLPLPTGGATEATLAAIQAAIGELALPGETQAIAGVVSVSNFPANQVVTVDNPIAGFFTETTGGSLLTATQALTKPGDTQAISAAALPLPAGAATGAKQDTQREGVARVRISGTRNTVGDGTAIIAAPATGQEVIISHLHIQASEAPVALQTVTLKGGAADSDGFPVLCDSIGNGFSGTLPQGSELRMGDGNEVFLNLTEATGVTYFLQYRVGAVL